MADGKILVAATSATFEFQGQRVFLAQGRTTVREGHPMVEGRESMFKPLTVDFEVESGAGDGGTAEKQPAARKPPARGGKQQ